MAKKNNKSNPQNSPKREKVVAFRDYTADLGVDGSQEPESYKEYYLRNPKAFYYEWYNDQCGGITRSLQSYFYSLRTYAEGRQSEQQYMNLLLRAFSGDEDSSETGIVGADYAYNVDFANPAYSFSSPEKREGFMNVLWDIVSPMPRMLATITMQLSGIDYDIVPNPIDPESMGRISLEKRKLWDSIKNKEYYNQIYQFAELAPPEEGIAPSSKEEFEGMYSMGMYKSEIATIWESIVTDSENCNDWKELYKMLLKDILTVNYVGARAYLCGETIRWEYEDPYNIAMQYSKYNDFRDSKWGFVKTKRTVGELRRYFPDNEKYNDAFWKKVGQIYDDNYEIKSYSNNIPVIDAMKVDVIDCYWVDSTPDYGDDGQRYNTSEKLHKCSWIIDTEEIYDYGLAENIVRRPKNQCVLPIKLYRGIMDKSMVAQAKPILDDIQILHLKYQNAIITAVNEGYFINADGLAYLLASGAKANNKNMAAAIQKFLQTGVGFYTETNAIKRGSGVSKPFEHHPGTFNEFVKIKDAFFFKIQELEYIVGLSPLVLGGQSQQDTAVKIGEMMATGTNNMLQQYVDACMSVKRRVVDDTIYLVLYLVKYNKDVKEYYEKLLGTEKVKKIIEAHEYGFDYNILLEARPTEFDKARIYKMLDDAMQTGQDGNSHLEPADIVIVENLLRNNGYKMAQWYLMKAKEDIIKRREKMLVMNQQLATQSKMQADAQTFQATLLLESFKTEGDILKSYADNVFTAMREQGKTEEEIKKAAIEMFSMIGMGVKAQQSQTEAPQMSAENQSVQ